MYGYVVPLNEELKIREFNEYRSFYCGLCRRLKKKYGFFAQFLVNYDITFLAVLFADLYDREVVCEKKRCAMHMCRGCQTAKFTDMDYMADITLYLGYLKCADDWNDEHSLKKKLLGGLLKRKVKRLRGTNELYGKIDACMDKLSKKEAELKAEVVAGYRSINPSISPEDYTQTMSTVEELSGFFGELLGEIFAVNDDNWRPRLYNIGYYVGKFIYLLDAFDDLEKDVKKKRFNALARLSKMPDFEDNVKEMLTFNIAEAARYYKQLPVMEYAPITDNILFAGVWTSYNKALEKKHKKRK